MSEESQSAVDVLNDDSLFQKDEFTPRHSEVPRHKRNKKLKKHDSSKKRRLDVSSFLDTEAQVGDDEDDNYEYDFLLPDESTEAERLEHRSRLKRLQEDATKREGRRVGGTGYLETAIDKLAKRYQDQTFEEGEDELVEAPEQVDYNTIEETTALMPDFGDPKLWIVKTNRQTPDRNLAISLMNKFIKLQSQGKNLGIYSCFVPDGVSGYLYIEADNKNVVTEALAEFRHINLSTLKLVPINEMSNVFNSGFENLYVPHVGEFVRVKFGRYAGDIGQVFESDEANNSVTLKLIPRIDPELLGPTKFNDNEFDVNNFDSQKENSLFNETVDQLKDTTIKLNGRAKNSQKFPKAFFDREAIELSGGLIEHGIIPGTFRFQGMTFLDSGHTLVKFSSKRLVCGDNVNASLSELKEFNVDSSISEAVGMMNKTPKKLNLYKLGEKIRVIKGELTSVVGKIVAIEKEEVEVQPDDTELPNFRINLNSVIKNLVEGDNVRAIGGTNEGQTGLVVLVNDKNKTALVFSPQSGQEFKCSLEHLSLIPKEGLGESNLRLGGINGFVVSDLIQTTNGQVGIIVAIDRNSTLTLLTDTGDRVPVSASQIQCKRSSFGNTAKDFNSQTIEPRSRVMVVKGNYKNKTGQVLHVWRNSVFVSLENGDIICVSSNDCLKSSGSTASTRSNSANSTPGARIVKKNPLVGKTVKILQGRYKGLLGDIIHVEPNQFTILLKVKPKTVRYPKSDCVILDNWHDVMRGHFAHRDNYVTYNTNLTFMKPPESPLPKGSSGFSDGPDIRTKGREGTSKETPRGVERESKVVEKTDSMRSGLPEDKHRDTTLDRGEKEEYRLHKESKGGWDSRDYTQSTGFSDTQGLDQNKYDKQTAPTQHMEELKVDKGQVDAEKIQEQVTQSADSGLSKLPNWCVNGVVVRVTGSGGYFGKTGVIGEVFENMADTSLQVLHVMVEEDYIAIASESVEPMSPTKPGDRVLVHSLGRDKYGVVTHMLVDSFVVQLMDRTTLTLNKDCLALVSSQ